jgi:hypothetical protein
MYDDKQPYAVGPDPLPRIPDTTDPATRPRIAVPTAFRPPAGSGPTRRAGDSRRARRMTTPLSGQQLDDLFGAVKDPTLVKQHEHPEGLESEVRLNLGYVKPAETPFTPVQGVTYLWVITEAGELVVGVENAKLESNAAAFSLPNARDHVDDAMLGHPTLAASFTPDGVAVPAKARIGGELTFDHGQWFINNASGRYSRGRAGDPTPLLENVAVLFAQYCDLTVGIRVRQ